jgi:hypothetical protein
MYSDRYVVLHCCQEKYLDEIKLKGIARETKAVFVCDLEKLNNDEIYNTLAVLTYHGIGIDGWTKLLKDNKKLNELDKNLIIFIAKISKEQEQIIENKKISNYYKICDKDGKTMDYCKIKDIGIIKNIIFTEKIPLLSIRIKDIENINPIKDRFFIKNTYNNLKLKEGKTIKEIEKMCYKIANEELEIIKKDIHKIIK